MSAKPAQKAIEVLSESSWLLVLNLHMRSRDAMRLVLLNGPHARMASGSARQRTSNHVGADWSHKRGGEL